jgi:hypothetical protein
MRLSAGNALYEEHPAGRVRALITHHRNEHWGGLLKDPGGVLLMNSIRDCYENRMSAGA